VSKLYSGSVHDFTIFKKELGSVFLHGSEKLKTLCVDLGFLGIQKIATNYAIEIPYKKSKYHPLSDSSKLVNKQLSSRRVSVENAIGNQKRYFILRQECRSSNVNKIQFEVFLCAGLANFKRTFTCK
jgi:hypothetical protein